MRAPRDISQRRSPLCVTLAQAVQIWLIETAKRDDITISRLVEQAILEKIERETQDAE